MGDDLDGRGADHEEALAQGLLERRLEGQATLPVDRREVLHPQHSHRVRPGHTAKARQAHTSHPCPATQTPCPLVIIDTGYRVMLYLVVVVLGHGVDAAHAEAGGVGVVLQRVVRHGVQVRRVHL